MLAQFSDINIHRTRIEVIIINPNGLQSKVALKNFISMRTEKSQKFVFLCSQLGLLIADGEQLFLCIEGETTDMIDRAFLVFLSANPT